MQKQKDFPFVYGQTVRSGDMRTNIDPFGSKILFIKKTTISNCAVFKLAYQNGNKGVVIGKTTIHHCFQWEFVLQKTKRHSYL